MSPLQILFTIALGVAFVVFFFLSSACCIAAEESPVPPRPALPVICLKCKVVLYHTDKGGRAICAACSSNHKREMANLRYEFRSSRLRPQVPQTIDHPQRMSIKSIPSIKSI